jgi:hypothetical protein
MTVCNVWNYLLFGLCPSSSILKTLHNAIFRELDLFLSSGEGGDLGRIPDDGASPKTEQFKAQYSLLTTNKASTLLYPRLSCALNYQHLIQTCCQHSSTKVTKEKSIIGIIPNRISLQQSRYM